MPVSQAEAEVKAEEAVHKRYSVQCAPRIQDPGALAPSPSCPSAVKEVDRGCSEGLERGGTSSGAAALLPCHCQPGLLAAGVLYSSFHMELFCSNEGRKEGFYEVSLSCS